MASRLRGAIERTRQLNSTQKQLYSKEEHLRTADSSQYQSPHLNPFKEDTRDNYRTYPYDYFSGTDCKVFYGDIWVDDIVSIQYSVSQNKTPIYGYASQNYNAVAKGHIIVEGTLTIAFKETGYLNLIQKISETQKSNGREVIKNKVGILQEKAEYKLAKFDPTFTYFENDSIAGSGLNASYTPNGSPQLIRRQETIEQILLGMKASQSLTKSYNLNEKTRDFEDFAEILEDSIWGDSNGRPLSRENDLKRADEFDYNPRGGVTVGYGQGSNATYQNCLNIMLTFGDINDYRAEHTIVLLNDVHFTSTTMIVTPDGSPIGESYSFFARDVNKTISKELLNINPIKLDVGVDDIKIAKLDDIEVIEQKLNQSNSKDPWILTFKLLAAFNNFGWKPQDSEEIQVSISMDKGIPLIDRMIDAVQAGINNVQFADIIKTDKSQYIIDAWFVQNENMTMVLEQGIPNTRTYKVIAPVRTGFRAPVIFTRDDLYTDITTLSKPLDEVAGILDKNKQDVLARKAELENRQKELNLEATQLGTSDELDELNKRRSKFERLSEDRNAKTALGIRIENARIERAIRKGVEAQDAYDAELEASLENRDYSREDRERLHTIGSEYIDLFNAQTALNSDADQLNRTQEQFNTEINILADEEGRRQLDIYDSHLAAIETEKKRQAEQQKLEKKKQEELENNTKEVESSMELSTDVSFTTKQQVPTHNKNELVIVETEKEHATRKDFANSKYASGQVKAFDVQNTKDNMYNPIGFPGSKDVYFDQKTGTGSFNITLEQGIEKIDTRVGFAHAQSVGVRPDGSIYIIPASPFRDKNQRSANPLLHLQTEDNIDFQDAMMYNWDKAGTNVYVANNTPIIPVSKEQQDFYNELAKTPQVFPPELLVPPQEHKINPILDFFFGDFVENIVDEVASDPNNKIILPDLPKADTSQIELFTPAQQQSTREYLDNTVGRIIQDRLNTVFPGRKKK